MECVEYLDKSRTFNAHYHEVLRSDNRETESCIHCPVRLNILIEKEEGNWEWIRQRIGFTATERIGLV